MQNAKLTWTDPTGPLTGIEIAMRVTGAPSFTILNTVAKGVQTFTQVDLADGSYDFRAVALNGSKRSAGVIISGSVVSPPGDVSGFAVTFT